MAKRIRNLSKILLGICCTQVLSAQTPPPLRELNFHVVSGSRIHNVRYGIFDETGKLIGSKPTGFRSSGRSLKYPYKGPATLVFFEEKPAPTKEDPQGVTRTQVGISRVPDHIQDVLFLFTENRDSKENGFKYDIQWMDISEENVPAGHVTIYNTLPIEFKGAVGKKNEKGKVIKASPGINPPISFYPQATLLLNLESKEEGVLRVYEDKITCSEEDRILLVLFPPRFPGSLNIGSKIITFPLVPPEKEKKDSEAPEK